MPEFGSEQRNPEVDDMKILVAIDSSAPSQYLISTAATRPWPSGTVFCVVNVVDMRQWEGLPVLIEDAQRQGQLLVKGAMEALAQSGHEVFSEVHLGFPKKAIPEYAREWGADLVMVGSHGRSALTRFLLGSVAQAVLRASPCSVEIVRPGAVPALPSDGWKILIATDGSECSAKTVYSVANRPWPAKSQIRILSVVELPIVQTTPSPAYSEYPDTVFESAYKAARTRAEDAVADARRTLSATDLKICDAEATPEGDSRSVILDVAKAWGSDLIVLGSHGRQGWDRLLMGSVAESVALHAHCSVEVIRQ
jgi:nucleotide-binding universal stress UspA family protein